ncbi:GreA/GreB family elongation factor [Adhaeribacter aquaticus]|uniref:GreA/GreB family elongation factor n=1 Tax=Adhaeribacter aquaticus TaxID=299567 RepID=UPI00047D0733|nr:GreA/GreB family elongation factor [Adhaeribacter aquaticus]
MSRAFVKEDDAGEPPIIPPRPALPPATPNYVTPRGLELLRAELTALEAERTRIEVNREDEANRTRQLSIINNQLSALTSRIASAKVVDLQKQPADEVRFGAIVRLKTISGGKPGSEKQFTIVGVDEASVAAGRIAFIAPIARAIQGARLHDLVTLQLGRNQEVVKVIDIIYKSSLTNSDKDQ